MCGNKREREREREKGQRDREQKECEKNCGMKIFPTCTTTLNLKKPKEINEDEMGAIRDKYERNDKFTHLNWRN